MTVVEEASRREKKQETKVYEDLEPAKTCTGAETGQRF